MHDHKNLEELKSSFTKFIGEEEKEKDMADSKTDDVHLSHHRVVMHLKQGGLHKALGVPLDKNIPKDKVTAAKKSTNPHVKSMAVLAQNMEGWHHGK